MVVLKVQSWLKNAAARADWPRRLDRVIWQLNLGFEVFDAGGAGFDCGDNLVLFGDRTEGETGLLGLDDPEGLADD